MKKVVHSLLILVLLTPGLAMSRPFGAAVQVTGGAGPLPSRPPLVPGEHASGGEGFFVAGGLSLLGLAGYDVATAPSSARTHNALNPEREPKSAARALALSLGSTILPAGAGPLALDRGVNGGLGVAAAGIVIGPSVGHWYAENHRRALVNAGIRAGLLVGSFLIEACCT